MVLPLLLHGKHGRPGAPEILYETLAGWIVPWRFTGFEEEYRALRTAAGLLDVSTLAVVECRGEDRTEFLHRILTNDLQSLAPGTWCRAALLTAQARLLADVLVLVDTEALRLLCQLPRAERMAQELERYHFNERITFTNQERSNGALAIQGPRTMETLSRLFGRAVALPHEHDHAEAAWEGVPLRVVRHSLAGDAGALILAPAEHLAALWHALQQEGAPAGLRPVGWEALTAARIEAGLPWEPADLMDEPLLPETGLEAVAVSGTKGCYIGQEIVARVDTYGSVNRRLMRLALEGDAAPQPGDAIQWKGEEAGRVTSACRSPARRQPLAFGYVKRGAYEPGTRVEIVSGGRARAAVVDARPFTRANSGETPAGARGS